MGANRKRKTLKTVVSITSKNAASVYKLIDVGQELRLFVLLASLGGGEAQSLFRESREATRRGVRGWRSWKYVKSKHIHEKVLAGYKGEGIYVFSNKTVSYVLHSPLCIYAVGDL